MGSPLTENTGFCRPRDATHLCRWHWPARETWFSCSCLSESESGSSSLVHGVVSDEWVGDGEVLQLSLPLAGLMLGTEGGVSASVVGSLGGVSVLWSLIVESGAVMPGELSQEGAGDVHATGGVSRGSGCGAGACRGGVGAALW